ncbi:MAG: nucleotidyl transferase AbiEii/AbiGii toxin family protein, partial [Gammaproteobacteria bacterium]|nr:nucleotidyl transferase AbiEii/AbiGii toxin family protein [Gammaproteobacteria bacterium]
MAERYLDLALADRREVLNVVASESGRPAYLLEKDI